jgi:hypothetical protein
MRRRISGAVSWLCALGAFALAGVPSHAEDRVAPSAAEVQPLAPGSRVPSARVASLRGDPVDLAELTRERGALLVFYRGGW